MSPTHDQGLFSILEKLTDPRGCQGQRHPFSAMLVALICGTLCGIRGMKPLAKWLKVLDPSTWHPMGFKRKPPCANAFTNLLNGLDPKLLEQAIREWVLQLEGIELGDETLQPVAIDGKVLRGSLSQHREAVHLLAAMDQKRNDVLSQTRLDPEPNEHKTAFKLLKTLVIKGKTHHRRCHLLSAGSLSTSR